MDEKVERGLQALVLANGRSSKAEERLKAAGERIPARTLRDWRNKYAERYEELEETRNDWMGKQMADVSEFLAAGYAEGEADLLQVLLSMPAERLKQLSPNVIAQAAKSLSIARAVSIDKANELRGRPTRPNHDQRDTMELVRLAIKKYPQVFKHVEELQAIDTTAKELPEETRETSGVGWPE